VKKPIQEDEVGYFIGLSLRGKTTDDAIREGRRGVEDSFILAMRGIESVLTWHTTGEKECIP